MRGMRRKLPKREYVFLMSLMYHGFRFTHRRRNLKINRGYIIPATKYEDSDGIDFWVKMPRDMSIHPVQVTQRGTKLYKKHKRDHSLSELEIAKFAKISEERVRAKLRWCKKSSIAFVLVRDFDGGVTDRNLAWGDIKALRFALNVLRARKLK